MARYCFYCNRELSAGERCSCRVAQAKRAEQSSSADNSTTDGFSTESPDRDPPPKNETEATERESPFKRFQNNADARRQTRADKQQQRSTVKQESSKARRSKIKFNWRDAFLNLGRNLFRAISKPTAFIQESSYPNIITATVTQAIEAYMLAFSLLRVLTLSNLGNLIAFGRSGANMPLSISERTLAFGKLYLIAILFFLVRVVINNLILRYVGRTRMSLVDTGYLLTPGSIYYCIFLVFGLLLSSGSGIQTLVIIVAGYGVRVIIDHLAIRMKTGQTEDAMLRMTLLIFLVTALVLGSIIGLLTPNLSEFRVDISGQFT